MKTKNIALFAAAFASVQPAFTADASPKNQTDKPNILVILADDLGYGDVQCYNPQRGKIPTPNIDRLASQGMRFTDAHSSSSVCSPSRYSLLTGRYHWRTRLQSGIVNVFGERLIAPGRLTIAGLVKQSGYRTACIGKWHLGWDWPIESENRKFFSQIIPKVDEMEEMMVTSEEQVAWKALFSKAIPGGPTASGFDSYFGTDVPNWPPFCFIENDRTIGIPTEFLPAKNYQKNLASLNGPALKEWKLEDILPALIDRASAFLNDAATKKDPFLLYLPLTAPHTPLAVIDKWRNKSGLNTYADFVMETDAMIGRILDTLEKTGLAKNTLVILTSDNGCAKYIGVKDLEDKGHFPSGPLRGYKMDEWEGGHRIPFIVRWPGVVKPSSVCNQLVLQADMLATFAGILHQKLPENAGEDSFSFLPLLKGEDQPVRRDAVNCSLSGVFTLRRGDWKLITDSVSAPDSGQGLFKNTRLYNLADDLGESNNLVKEFPGKAKEMSSYLEQLIVKGRSTEGKDQKNDVVIKRYQRISTSIIPMPSSLRSMPGTFNLDKKTRIFLSPASLTARAAVDIFRMQLAGSMGFEMKYAANLPGSRAIVISQDNQISNREGYCLTVDKQKIEIRYRTESGLFYAFQTLRQLLPGTVESKTKIDGKWIVPCVEITDEPRFEYRGFMLDVARHFQPIEVLKKYVDLLAFYKINHFHLHLTDDQGWRIEIKKYPKLQEISSWRKESVVGHFGDKPRKYDGIRHGGFYTQEQLKELVRYAQERFITIIPEIEMPGHSTAALAAYPELTCFPKKFEVTPDYGVFEDVYCTKESTFKFLEDVLSEVVEIFPSKLIHIGGDECPKTRWKVCPTCQQRMKEENLKNENELQSYFIRRIQKFLNSKGRNIIGWDEIVEGGLTPGATLMYWRTWLKDQPVLEAAKDGFKVIMSPLEPFYFNLYEDKEKILTPLAYPGLIPLENVYKYNPVSDKLNAAEAKNIIGIQANLWSEYVTTGETAEYMTFPRLCALAEGAWSPAASKDYADFIRRLKINSSHLDQMHVNYSKYFKNQ